jgi:hypothetical protein
MTQDLTSRAQGDDGFSGSLTSALFKSSNYINWNDNDGWIDRDGLPAPSPMLVFAIDEALQRWKDNRQELIRDKPLPDPEELNTAIPKEEWERGLDGNERPPWQHVVIVCFIDPQSGTSYRYTASTRGAHIAYDELKEAVITMRAMRGADVVPLVALEDRPFKTQFGMRKRPFLRRVGWKLPGGEQQKAAVPASSTPQLPSPGAAEKPPVADKSTAAAAAAAKPMTTAKPQPRPPVKLANETLDTMGDVKPVTMEEIFDDKGPW